MEVAFACRAVAEVGDRHIVAAVELPAERVAGRVRDLCRDGDADRPEACRAGVVRPAVPRPAVVLEVLHGVDTADQRNGQLAEGRPDEVAVTEGPRRADLRRLLAFVARVDGQLALPLQRDACTIDPDPKDSTAYGWAAPITS